MDTSPLVAWRSLCQGPLADYRDQLVTEGCFVLAADSWADGLYQYGQRAFPALPAVAQLTDWARPLTEALAAEWARPLWAQLVIPTLSLLVLTGQTLSFSLSTLQLRVGADGRSQGWQPSSGLQRLETTDELAAASRYLQQLVSQGWAPLIQRLSQLSAADPRLLWNLAAGYWHWWLQAEPLQQALQALPATEQPAALRRRALAESWINQARLPLGPADTFTRNPLFRPWRDRREPGGLRRVRSLCCCRYRLPTLAMCPSCPLESPQVDPSETKEYRS